VDDFWEAFFLLLIFVPIAMIWVAALFDIFRRDDIGGITKALWVLAIVFLPLFGTLIYLILRSPGGTPEERKLIDQSNREFVAKYAPTDSAEQLRVLADLHDRGKLTDAEFAAEKARVLGTNAAASAAAAPAAAPPAPIASDQA
jgi:hypothetical protein